MKKQFSWLLWVTIKKINQDNKLILKKFLINMSNKSLQFNLKHLQYSLKHIQLVLLLKAQLVKLFKHQKLKLLKKKIKWKWKQKKVISLVNGMTTPMILWQLV